MRLVDALEVREHPVTNEIRSFRDLVAWQRAMELCKAVYKLTGMFPESERFGLTAQIRRAVVSIPSNIAEGYGRRTRQEFVRFLSIARGSLHEVETQLILAGELGLVPGEAARDCLTGVDQCGRVLYGLIRSVESSNE